MLKPGMLICGKYMILEEIGRGGMSRVFLSEDIGTGGRKAIKAISCGSNQSQEQGKGHVNIGLRADTEIDMLKKLSHPGLPKIEEVIENQEEILIVMEHIPGSSLQNQLAEYGAQPKVSVLGWMLQLCDILGYMHTRNPPVIYRDVKPSNIMLAPDGRIMLIDFGAAREYEPSGTEDTVLLGTRGYAAPEQYGGHGQSDPRTDIYGLGATMYHLLSGHDPSKPPYMRHPLSYWNPELPAALVRLVRKCTRADPDERYASCNEISYVLRELLKNEKKPASGHTEVISKERRDHRIETDITIVYTNKVIP